MSLSRRTLSLALALALSCVAPAAAWAQGGSTGATPRAQGDGAARAALLAERQRLRVDLERANAEIDGLKRANRSLRDDYRLRARLADAEALARRLTELDARLGGGAATRESWPTTSAEPHGLPSDGPAELEAKADILSDQSRRLAARGDALLSRARDLKARQNLRRRVGQMERDPFSPLEGSKRRTMATGPVGATGGGTPAVVKVPTTGTSPERNGNPGPVATDQAAPPPTAPAPGGASPALGPTPGAAQTPGATALPSTPPSTVGLAVTSPKTAPTPTAPTGLAESAALSAQLRDLLDPATLAELQRIERTAGPVSGVEALERAGAALKARAERLEREAATLRAARAR